MPCIFIDFAYTLFGRHQLNRLKNTFCTFLWFNTIKRSPKSLKIEKNRFWNFCGIRCLCVVLQHGFRSPWHQFKKEDWSLLSSKKIFGGTFHTKNEGWDLNMLSRAVVGKTFLSWDPILVTKFFFSTENSLLAHILSEKNHLGAKQLK